ncbi:condensation domain-containing protein [Streptosporangium sp. KLBMP 9127]|nr:condensation domain-containing protein [Streptosporangium sp. KLBMP 9127]
MNAPLTFAQEQIYHADRENPQVRTPVYFNYRLRGAFDPSAFVEALDTVVRDNEALRVVIDEGPGGRLRQRTLEPSDVELVRCQDVRSNSAEQFDRYARGLNRKLLLSAWDPARDQPFAFVLLRNSPTLHAFLAVFPHLVIDGLGRDLLVAQLWRHYAKSTGTRPPSLLAAARAQRAALGAPAAAANRAYWRRSITSSSPVYQSSHISPPDAAEEGCEYQALKVSGRTLMKITRDCRKQRCTRFQWLLAAVVATLLDFTPQDRLTINVPVDTRGAADGDVVGMFTLVLPMTVVRTGESTPVQVRRTLMDALRHAYVDRDTLAGAGRELAGRWDIEPSVTVAANLRHGKGYRDLSPSLDVELTPGAYDPPVSSSLGVSLHIEDAADRVSIGIAFGRSRFSPAATASIMRRLAQRIDDADAQCSAGENPQGLTRVGQTEAVFADLRATRELLLAHPLVAAARVEVSDTARVEAVVRTRGRVEPGELEAHCAERAAVQRFVLPPKVRVDVPPAGHAGVRRPIPPAMR